MSRLLTWLFGRLPIGWLQLTHNRTRFAAALAGVAFAILLVFMQLGIMGALNNSTIAPFSLLRGDILISSTDGNTLTDSGNVARARMYQALGVAGVKSAAPVYIGTLPLSLEDGSSAALLAFGIDTAQPEYTAPRIVQQLELLKTENTALLDKGSRGVPADIFESITPDTPFTFEINGQTMNAIGTITVGGGFLADGTMVVSDQTFLRFSPSRVGGAPSHILVQVADGARIETVVTRLQAALPADSVKVQTMQDAAAADLAFMSSERPTGIIFGFGVLMGIIVGLVIVYQVLSTDVADHLKEYATFKAMGYDHPFFLGVVFEEALILAIFGFIPGFLAALGLYNALVSVTGLPVIMQPSTAILIFFGTLAACSLSGAIATRRLVAADPADLF